MDRRNFTTVTEGLRALRRAARGSRPVRTACFVGAAFWGLALGFVATAPVSAQEPCPPATCERTDLEPIPYERTMDLSLPQTARIQAHLRTVEADLRSSTPADLSAEQRAARAEVIDHLGHYWREGVFPINDFLPGITPVFIDRVGTHCAVGELMRVSGAAELARTIADTENFVTVRQLAGNAGVAAWAQRVGLTIEECARIQPGYCWSGEGVTDLAATVHGNTITLNWIVIVPGDTTAISVSQYDENGTYITGQIDFVAGTETTWTSTPLETGNYQIQITPMCWDFPGGIWDETSCEILPTPFIRGDSNADGLVNIADVVRILGFLFVGEAPLACAESGDTNSDGTMNIADAIFAFEHLFYEGASPAAPFPACGEITSHQLSCDTTSICP